MQIERETFLLLSSFLYSRKWKLRVSDRKASSVLASIIRGVCGSTPGSDPCRSVRKHVHVLEAAKWMNITSLTSLRCQVRQRYSVLLMVVISIFTVLRSREQERKKGQIILLIRIILLVLMSWNGSSPTFTVISNCRFLSGWRFNCSSHC